MSAARTFRLFLATTAATLTLWLGGCATARMIDSDVVSFTTAPGAVQPATYRFERLPSQTIDAQQSQLESMAAVALAKVGLTPHTTAPHYAVQVSMLITTIRPTYPQPSSSLFWRRHDERRMGVLGFGLHLEQPWYRHAVRLLLRDVATAQVVYETTATFDGPWADSGRLLPVVLDAALQGYPNPPAGPRKVVIELPAGMEGEN